MEREAWRPFLERWSREWLVVDEERRPAFDEEVMRSGWLGFPPATPEEVAAAEARLGRVLPPSLRAFLLVTNGWRQTNGFIDELAGTGELAWLRDTTDSHWIDAYGQIDDGETGAMMARSLRLSLSGDAAIVFLDPDDRDADGEWAAYDLASWSGMGPERRDSFRDLMERHYASFHALYRPPGATRDHWDRRVEDARDLALAGQIDEPWAVLEEAGKMGRHRARFLLFQLAIMQGDWYRKPLSDLVMHAEHLVGDPVLLEQVLSVIPVASRRTHGQSDFLFDALRQSGGATPFGEALLSYESRAQHPDFRPGFGDPDFDAAVHGLVDRLADERSVEAVWPALLAAVGRWRPASEDLIAPIALLADPVLGPLITPERGRQILSVPRGV